jgi:hypothetical protein
MTKSAFLSSTARDLWAYRDAVYDAIQHLDGWKCIRMEDFGARDRSPDGYCREQVAASDVFVGVIGQMYGSSPPEGNYSFTEGEYDAAKKAGVPRLIFVTPDDIPLPASLRESDENHSKQQAFRKLVHAERIPDEFQSAEKLALAVVTALRNWETELATRQSRTAAIGDLANSGKILREQLELLSGVDLQSLVVEPLLHARGFEDVRDVSPSHGNGRELLAVKDEMGTQYPYRIFIRTGRFDDSQTLVDSLTPDRLLLITPSRIDRAAIDGAIEKHAALSRNALTIVEGTTLASEILRWIPHVAAGLCAGLDYRLHLISEQSVITESRSFGLQTLLDIGMIFVEADYACFDSLEELLASFLVDPVNVLKGERPPDLRSPCHPDELAFLARQEARWSPAPVPPAVPPTLEGFMASLIAFVDDIVDSIAAFGEHDSKDVLDDIHRRISTLQSAIFEIRKTSILQKRSHLVSPELRKSVIRTLEGLSQRHRLFTYRHLYRANSILAIVGAAGAGKSTLMRLLAIKGAEEDLGREVIFVRAIDVPDRTVDGFLRHLLTVRNSKGSSLSDEIFNAKMTAGKVRILVDGLDEAGEGAQALARTVHRVTQRFPQCPVAVTSRETVDLSEWQTAIHLKLCPFNDSQLGEFIDRWFATKPSARQGLKNWLREHKDMETIAKTPLVAALLCSLYNVGETEMPLSETELYEKRLDFLLGRWEQAKAIPQMPDRARGRYTLLLMHLAYYAHEHQRRSFEKRVALDLTTRFLTPGFNPNGDSQIRDCIGRGLLETEANGDLSLGHLALQEFLVGKYLQKYNDLSVIASRIGNDWWRRPLYFYASLVSDLGGLVRYLKPSQRSMYRQQLLDLLSTAADTSTDDRNLVQNV